MKMLQGNGFLKPIKNTDEQICLILGELKFYRSFIVKQLPNFAEKLIAKLFSDECLYNVTQAESFYCSFFHFTNAHVWEFVNGSFHYIASRFIGISNICRKFIDRLFVLFDSCIEFYDDHFCGSFNNKCF